MLQRLLGDEELKTYLRTKRTYGGTLYWLQAVQTAASPCILAHQAQGTLYRLLAVQTAASPILNARLGETCSRECLLWLGARIARIDCPLTVVLRAGPGPLVFAGLELGTEGHHLQ